MTIIVLIPCHPPNLSSSRNLCMYVTDITKCRKCDRFSCYKPFDESRPIMDLSTDLFLFPVATRRNKVLDPTARGGCDQACGLPPPAVFAGQHHEYPNADTGNFDNDRLCSYQLSAI